MGALIAIAVFGLIMYYVYKSISTENNNLEKRKMIEAKKNCSMNNTTFVEKNKVYDTRKSKQLATRSCDNNIHQETLYKTNNKEYFILYEVPPLRIRKAIDFYWVVEPPNINVLPKEAAIRFFIKCHGPNVEEINKNFGKLQIT